MSDPLDLTAAATLGLALVTAFLARSTGRSAKEAKRGIDLQAREVALFERQLKLGEDQAQAAREAARPMLRFGQRTISGALMTTTIDYAYGTDPAHDVTFWARDHEGLDRMRVGIMVPTDAPQNLFAASVPESEWRECPFEAFLADPGEGNRWSGLARRRPDGTLDGFSTFSEIPNAVVDEDGNDITPPAPRPKPGPAPKDPQS